MKAGGFLLLFCLLPFFGWAQAATLSGKVTDSKTGEALIGASVLIQGTTKGSATDWEGNYSISSVEAGTHTLEVYYVGYNPKTITVKMEAGAAKTLNIQLQPQAIDLGEATVAAKASRKSEAAMLAMRKQQPIIQDIITAEEFSQAGDGDAGAAMKRVTGASVVDGKYVFVRGLSDRYVKTTLNGATIPGVDPERNSTQMDIFPTALIDNISVIKSITPDLPGDFTGGVVNITTKDFPEELLVTLSASSSYNTLSSFNDQFLTYQGGKTDWLGFDDGTRAIPGPLQGEVVLPTASEARGDVTKAQLVDELSRSFNSIMTPEQGSSFTDYSLGFAIGNKIQVAKNPLGFIVTFDYDKNYDFYENGTVGQYKLTGQVATSDSLVTELNLNDTRGVESVNWGSLANVAYQVGKQHKLGLTYMINQGGVSTARYLSGENPSSLPGMVYETRVLGYEQRNFQSLQLKGEHTLNWKDVELSWQGARISFEQDEPDLRFFTNHYEIISNKGGNGEIIGTDTSYSITRASYPMPARYFRHLDQVNYEGQLDAMLPFEWKDDLEGKLKAGLSYIYKDREFTERRFSIEPQAGSDLYTGNGNDFFTEGNTGIDTVMGGQYWFANTVEQRSLLRNNYTGMESRKSGYVMAELPLSNLFQIVGGVRVEDVLIESRSADTSIQAGVIDNLSILPSVNLIYDVAENMKLRAGYGKTVARPTFREIAPYESFSFIGGYKLRGNPDLKSTTIQNVDLRWEYFPRMREIIAFSVFYKYFRNPIERVIDPVNSNKEIEIKNLPSSQVFGAEIELKKRLDILHSALSNFNVGLNAAYIRAISQIDTTELADIRALDPDAEGTRPLVGQSPYLVNASLGYENDEADFSANLYYNVFGPRLTTVATGAIPDIYERPRNMIDFSVSKTFREHFSVKLGVKNLLNENYVESHLYKGSEYTFRYYPLGRTYSVGLKYQF